MTKTVLHMISNRWNSAITEYALSSARSMKFLKYRNIFVCLKEKPVAVRAREAGFEVVEIDDFSVQNWSLFSDLAEKYSPDFVLTYGGPEMIMCWPMRAEGRKLIRIRGNLFHPRLFNRSFYRMAHRHIDEIVAPSMYVKEQLPRRPGRLVVPIGIDEREFTRQATKKMPRPELMIFGRLDPIKGHLNFIRLFADLVLRWNTERCPKPVLKIAGREENTKVAELEASVYQHGLIVGEDVIFETGTIENRALALSQATIGVVSSLGSELICRVAQEFLMCGTPVAVTRVGSLPEVIREKEFGETFDHKATNILHLEDFIVRVFNSDESQRNHIAALAHKHFSLATMARTYQDILDPK